LNQRDNILAQVLTVPSLPVAAVKVISVLQKPHAELCEIARVINHDPGLATNALRLANSAMYGGQRKIDTIDMAVARLGVRRMLDLVVSSVVKPFAMTPVQGYDLPPGMLWLHSVAVACGAEELGKLLKIDVPSCAFTCGLLIDVGKNVLSTYLEVDGQAIRHEAFEQHVSFEQAERHVLGIDHAEVGAALLKHWGLPDALVAAARWHHEPSNCPPEHQALIDLVHASDQICTLSGIGTGSDGSNYKPCEATMARLKIDVHVIEATMCRIVERLDALEDILGQTSERN